MENKKRKMDLFEDSDDSVEAYSDGDIEIEEPESKLKKDKKDKKIKKKKKIDNNNGDSVQNDDEDFAAKLEEKIQKSSSKKTSKLIELQSKFAYDSRFVVDERFVDDIGDNEDEEYDDYDDKRTDRKESDSQAGDDDHVEEAEVDIKKERSKNLSILEHVLGKQIKPVKKDDSITEFRKAQVSKKASSAFSTVLVPRFDPSKEDSKKFELQANVESINRKLNIDFDELDRKNEEAKKRESEARRKANLKGPLKVPSGQPVKSFYEVTPNLKDAFGDSGDFVFDTFFDDNKTDLKAVNEAAEEVPLDMGKKIIGTTRNPFKYDSSDDEDDGEYNDPAPEQNYEEGEEEEEEEEEKEQTKGTISNAMPKRTAEELQIQSISSTAEPRKERKRVPVIEFTGFFFAKNDPRLTQEPFWTEERSKKMKEDSTERKERMRIALGLRKKAAQKNVQMKKRIEKKRMLLTPKQFKASMVNQKRLNGRKRPFRNNKK